MPRSVRFQILKQPRLPFHQQTLKRLLQLTLRVRIPRLHRDGNPTPVRLFGLMPQSEAPIKLRELEVSGDIAGIVIPDELKLPPRVVLLSGLDVLQSERVSGKRVLRVLFEKALQYFDSVHSSAHFPSPSQTRRVQGSSRTLCNSRCRSSQMFSTEGYSRKSFQDLWSYSMRTCRMAFFMSAKSITIPPCSFPSTMHSTL